MSSKDLLLRCQSLYKVLDGYLDQDLSRLERLFVRGHLMMCPTCRIYLQQYKEVREVTDQPIATDLPKDFDRVMQRVVGRWREERDI